jgi:hypothetical protein
LLLLSGMRKKPKKSYKAPPAAGPAATPGEQTPAAAPRTKRVKEVPLSAKEQSRAAKRATRARWLSAHP